LEASTAIKLSGAFGLIIVILIYGYLFYDKNPIISISLVLVGLSLSIYVTYYANKLRESELEGRRRGYFQ